MSEIAPLINGYRYSYASIEIAAQLGATNTAVLRDVEAISYSEELEIAFKRGAGRAPLGTTSGIYTPQDGQFTIGKSKFQEAIQKIGPGWLGITFLMVVTFKDIGEILTVDKITARLRKVEEAHEAGSADPLKSVVTFLPISEITRNGVPSLFNRVV